MVATLLRLYIERPSLEGGARSYPPRDGGSEGDSGGEIPDRWLKRFPGCANELTDKFCPDPPMLAKGDPPAGAALPDA